MEAERRPIFVVLLVVMAVLGAVHRLAIQFFWYWSVWWTDIFTHYLGGVAVGLAVVWFLLIFGVKNHRKVFFYVILAILVVGIAWELFEFGIGQFVVEDPFPDNVFDVSSDVAGALSAYVYWLVLLVHRNRQND